MQRMWIIVQEPEMQRIQWFIHQCMCTNKVQGVTHHRALHDAFEEDEIQVISRRWTGAVAQCVQSLMHGYKAKKKRQ